MKRSWPAAVGLDDFVDFLHEADGLAEGDDDAVVVGDFVGGSAYTTLTGTSVIVSFPKMSITFTVAVLRPGLASVCGALVSLMARLPPVRTLACSLSRLS